LAMGSKMPYQDNAIPTVPRDWKVIEVRSVPNDVARLDPTDVAIIADVKETAKALIEAISSEMSAAQKATAQQRSAEAGAFNQKVRQAREQFAASRRDAVPVSWERVAQEANLVMEENAIINHEFGSAAPRVLPWFEFGRGKKELIGRTLGSGLGWSVGASVGIKMAKPDRQVVCFLGDGAFMMGQVEALWAARRFEAPVMYVVFNNRSYNDTRLRQTATAPRLRELKRDLGNYLGSPDVSFEQLAKGFDVKGATVTQPGEIADALKEGVRELQEGRPFVLDVQAERTGVLAESTWYPRYSVAEQRTKKV
jgi:thiamine pyrophosphate-dependent acetolactate synthase large subunit-like protein